MLSKFSEVRIFLPGPSSGYGFVFWSFVTLTFINRYPRVHGLLTFLFNALMRSGLGVMYQLRHHLKGIDPRHPFSEWAFYWIYLHANHGFCAWGKK